MKGIEMKEVEFVTGVQVSVLAQNINFWRRLYQALEPMLGNEIEVPDEVTEFSRKSGLRYPVRCFISQEQAMMMLGQDPRLAKSIQDPFRRINFISAPEDLWKDPSRVGMIYHEIGHLAAGEHHGSLFTTPHLIHRDMSSPNGHRDVQLLGFCHVHADLWADDEMFAVDPNLVEKNLRDRLLNGMKYCADGQIDGLLRSPAHMTTLMIMLIQVERYGFESRLGQMRDEIVEHMVSTVPLEASSFHEKFRTFLRDCPFLEKGAFDKNLAILLNQMNYLIKLFSGGALELKLAETGDESVPHAWLIEESR